MPERLEIAYSLIAIMLVAAVYGLVRYNRYRKEQRRIERGGRPRREIR